MIHYVHHTPAILRTQSRTYATRAYTPGEFGIAQPDPHDTMPISAPFATNGPPESPVHESLPPSGYPAHNIRSVILLDCAYISEQIS